MRHSYKRNALHLALSVACAIGSAGLAAAESLPAPRAEHVFDIPAGPLGQALTRFGDRTGLRLVVASEWLAGQRSAGLRGTYDLQDGIRQLLAGTGLRARLSGDTLLLEQVADDGQALELGVTSIESSGLWLGEVSEGSGSYTKGRSRAATGLAMSLRETPQSISVITRQRIEDQSLNSIGEVLEQAPGINVQSPGSDRLYVYSRGLAIDNYQYDGMPTTSFAFTQALPQALADMASYDQVEVLRGATGLLSGAGEPSGTVNLIRKKPTETFQGRFTVGAGSWDLYRSEIDVSGPLSESGHVRGRAVAAYQQNNSFVDHLQQEKTTLYGILEADLSETTRLTFGVDYLRSDPRGFSTTGLPVIDRNGQRFHTSRSDNAASRDSSNEQSSLTTFASLEQKLDAGWTLKLSLNHLYGKRDYDSIIVGTTTGFIDAQSGDRLRYTATKGDNTQEQRGLELRLSGPFQALGREHELVAGFSYQDYENRRNGYGNLLANGSSNNGVSGLPVNYYQWNNRAPVASYNFNREDDDINQWQNGVYLATRLKPTDDLAVILGTRVSNYRYDARLDYHVASLMPYATHDNMRANGEVTPYAGIVYDLDDSHSLYASYTSIFKPQPYRERSGRLLEPREGDNYELGLKSAFYDGRLNTALSVFEVRLDNDSIADGTLNGNSLITAYRASRTRTRGADLEVSGEIRPDWQLAASYSHSVVKDADGERVKAHIPVELLKVFTTYRLPGALNRLTVGGGINWQSGIHMDVDNWQLPAVARVSQGSFATVNLMGRYQLAEDWTLSARVNNLFDKHYLSALDENFYSASWGSPRSFIVTSQYTF
ncbi:TonB-dependent siderophore receptor [Pseudomonas sp. ABC1]|uniref:TonB-dependent siderophore receptor n=1 Tax=Pseudomonas sp. ABC1 TaxID=2748080 RepID=UPI0015C3AB2D|nr:TonB-dependent receptor [Pseudomonas sp. ABC1]QLF94006.1 TonB-dependent siderophore receptor [Pseudomonas sp. ABC1]